MEGPLGLVHSWVAPVQHAGPAMSLPRRPLGATGLEVSVLGFGASPLGSVFSDIDEDEGVAAVHEAVRLGINFFDVSPFYGSTRAETVLGRALKDIPRDKFVLSTKVGRYGPDDFDFGAARVKRSVDESLARLHVAFIDVIQCHDIEFGSIDQIVNETLPALQELKRDGKVRFVGITGLPLRVFSSVLDRTTQGAPPGAAPAVDVVLSYCHHSLNDTSLKAMLPYLHDKGVGVISASPLSMGLLTEQGPPAWHPAPQMVQIVCRAAAGHCKARKASLAKLALQFAIREDRVATTLVGMCTRAQVQENVDAVLEALAGKMDSQLLGELEVFMKPILNVTWPSGRQENN